MNSLSSINHFCGLYVYVLSLENTQIFSWILICFWLACIPLPDLFFNHINSSLKLLILLFINFAVNGWLPNKTIAQLFFIILLYCSHSGSNGMMLSHWQAVVPYGKSQSIISTDLSEISFIKSRQSPLYNLYLSSIFTPQI